MNLPKIRFEKLDFEESCYIRDNCEWKATTLLRECKRQRCKPFALPLAGINLSVMPFDCSTIDEFVYQLTRVNQTDLKYPVILDNFGIIADGWHRVAKALMNGKTSIMAMRLENMPPPDKIIPK